MKKQKFPFAILCDTEKTMGKAYGAENAKFKGFPARKTFLVGADGKIEKVWDDVGGDLKKHAQEVLDAIKTE